MDGNLGYGGELKTAPTHRLMPKVIEPLYGTKSDYAIAAMIAERLGLYDQYTEGGKTEEDWFNQWVDTMVTDNAAIYGDRDSFVARGSMTVPYDPNPPVAFADFIADPAAAPLGMPSGLIEIFSRLRPLGKIRKKFLRCRSSSWNGTARGRRKPRTIRFRPSITTICTASTRHSITSTGWKRLSRSACSSTRRMRRIVELPTAIW